MDADGSNQTRLTFASGSDVAPSWSHDGTGIAFSSARDAQVVRDSMNEAYGDEEVSV